MIIYVIRNQKVLKTFLLVDPDGPVVIIFAIGSEVRGFKPGRGRWIFQSGRKAVGPVTARKFKTSDEWEQ